MHGVARHERTLYLVAIIASILLSCWAVARTWVINPDGIRYLQNAAMMPQNLSATLHLAGQDKWPFYSLFILGLVKISKLSFSSAAFLLDGFLTAISVVTFIAIVRLLTSSLRIAWLGAAVILFSHEFNALRTEIIRDHGFWAFYLVSIFFLLRYFRLPQWRFALAWSVSLIVATLFRIEGAIFLLLMPWIAWLNPVARMKSFLQLNTVTIFFAAVISVFILIHPQISLGRFSEVLFQLGHGISQISQNFHTTANALGQHVLSIYSARDATLVLLIMLLGWYVASVAVNISLIYAVLVIYAWWKKLFLADKTARLVLWGYVVVNVLITAIFLVDNMFLAKRYLIALSLVLMLWVPFALNDLIYQAKVRKWLLILTIFFMLFYAMGGMFEFGSSKKYIREAGDWIAINAPPQAKFYTNDSQLLYYSNHFGQDFFATAEKFVDPNAIAHGQWQQYDYVALRVNKQESAEITKEISLVPVQVFKNKRGDEVMIYKIH